ncbi:ABC transporter substrate-binding protein [Poseidonocella sp. HB161398]|uniref:ABC transporter substrate-binding protein n=1 Tax=Poseidonocella sp. HB161398 TaxID=2320855 RepID=UPI0014865B7E|nr:ABC transporter substrate-binding protein [Poseidonocella sp. HB161398]
MAGDMPSLDPMVRFTANSWRVSPNLYNGLTRFDADGTVQPDLATSWEADAETQSWTFTLREGVLFHDGEAFTSADVKATFDKMLDPETSAPYRAEMGPITSVDAPDELTVIFHLSAPFADLPSTLATSTAKIISARGIADFENITVKPYGTGPFRLVSFTPNDRLELEANPDYFDGRPELDRILIRLLPDTTAQITALRNKEVDAIADLDGSTAIDLASYEGVEVQEVPGGNFNNLVLLADRPPFSDNRVREALKLCIDREALADVLTESAGVVANDHPVSEVYRYFDADLPMRTPDLEKAKALLVEAGYPDGFEHKIVVGANPPAREKLAVLVQAMAQQIGINFTIEKMDNSRFLSTVWNKGTESYVGNYVTRPTADLILTKLYHAELGIDEGRWATPESNAILEEARATTDEAKRSELYAQFQEMAKNDGPFIISAFYNNLAANNDYVIGFPVHRIGLDMPLAKVTLADGAPSRG